MKLCYELTEAEMQIALTVGRNLQEVPESPQIVRWLGATSWVSWGFAAVVAWGAVISQPPWYTSRAFLAVVLVLSGLGSSYAAQRIWRQHCTRWELLKYGPYPLRQSVTVTHTSLMVENARGTLVIPTLQISSVRQVASAVYVITKSASIIVVPLRALASESDIARFIDACNFGNED